jgi:hypothetical protein
VSLKFLEQIYDYSLDKWVWLDISANAIYVNSRKKKASKQISKGFYSMDWSFIFGRRTGEVQCSYCGLFVGAREITRDHIVPKSQGGTFTAPACAPCNDLKKDTKPIPWAIEASMSGLAFGGKREISKALILLTKDLEEDT